MKHFKVFSAFLPLLAIACFIYFSTSGFSSTQLGNKFESEIQPVKIVAKKPNGLIYLVHLTNTGGGHCLTGDYTYCIDGGTSSHATGDFYVELNCDEYHTICINSSQGCYGTWTGYIDCKAIFPQIDIDLSTTPVECLCS